MRPVAIVPAQTGVTDGNAAQHESTYVPRSRIAFSAGAEPEPIARSSIVGFIPSMTVSTSLGGLTRIPRISRRLAAGSLRQRGSAALRRTPPCGFAADPR